MVLPAINPNNNLGAGTPDSGSKNGRFSPRKGDHTVRVATLRGRTQVFLDPIQKWFVRQGFGSVRVLVVKMWIQDGFY